MPTCAIMQPTYLPWIGYFDLIDSVDIFVLLDTVQLTRRSWQVRNRVKYRQRELMLTIPVLRSKNRDELRIMDAQVDDSEGWRDKHLRSVRDSYASAPFGGEAIQLVEAALGAATNNLAQITGTFIEQTARAMGIGSRIVPASQLGPFSGRKDTLLVEICKAVQADHYLSARGSAEYIEEGREGGAFAGSGVALSYQQYEHPIYPQLGDSFLPFMGVPDLIASVGLGNALEVVRSGRRPALSSSEVRAERAQGD